jgi:Flp pilus assembly protein TadG
MNFRRFPYAQHFLRDNRGNVLPIFALSLLPVLALVGMGIDYGRSSAANAKLQTAVDSTALAMATNAASLSASDLAAQANAYFLAVLSGAGVVNPTITTSYSNTNGSQLVVNGSATVNTYFLGLPPISKSAVNISSSSTIAWGSSRLRVALVLDNTGSMAQSGKMGALQTATKNLLSQLKTAAVNNGDVYVSIIPFVKDVNVGSTNYNGNWIDWTDWDANNGTCGSSGGGGNGNNGNGNGNGNNGNGNGNNGNGNGNNGNGNGNNGNGNNGGGGGGSSKSSCNGTWTPAAHSTWNGCITDRTQSYDTNVTAPTSGTVATLFPSEQYGSCPLQLKGLSYDWTSMNTLVNQMTPNGNTNQAIGLAWGWLSLVGGGPLTAPAMDSNYQY